MRAAWPALGYVAVFGALGWPWLRHAADAVPYGNPFAFPDDARFWVWQLGWVAHALATDPGRVLDANIHHPAPAQLTSSEHLASTQLVAVPAVWLTGNPVLVANLLVLASYPLAALAMGGLLGALGCTRLVAWTGGLVFALGPLRVPGNLEVLHFLNLYLALGALALHRLRDVPRAGRAGVLCAVLTAGVLSGYYLAVMLALATAAWSAVELARHRPERARFVWHVAWAGTVATLVLLVVSIPYFERPEQALGLSLGGLRPFDPDTTSARDVAILLRLLFGVAPGLLAVAGLAALASRDAVARRLAIAGVVVSLTGFLFVFPPPILVAALDASPLRFLRAEFRFATVAGLGTACLAATALELVRAGLGRRAGAVAAVVVAALVATTHGLGLSGVRRDVMEPFASQRALHDAVGDVARREGPGPLLVLPLVDADRERHGSVLPLGQLESDDMVASVHHWLPLVGGHTGHPPLHRPVLEAAIRRLPRSDALDDLVDLGHVRWLLLRPADYWADPAERAAIAALDGVTPRLERDGWLLARVDRPARRPWFGAIAAGHRPGHTVLGTPLAPLDPADAIGIVRAGEPIPASVTADGLVPIELEVRNAGAQTWPVTLPARVLQPFGVRGRVEWRRIESAGEPTRQWIAFRRDVPPGDVLADTVTLRAPREPGTYDLTIALEQHGGAGFDGPGNAPLRARVVVIGPSNDR